MKTFQLEILSPTRSFYVGPCLSLVVPISDGMLGIMADHTPLSAAILDGEVHFTLPDGARRICAVTCGMVDVSGSRVRLLCDTALAPDEIDEAAERLAAERAAEEMKRSQSRKEYRLWQLSLTGALNNLRVKKHSDEKINL